MEKRKNRSKDNYTALSIILRRIPAHSREHGAKGAEKRKMLFEAY
jgi:hypothetical protein